MLGAMLDVGVFGAIATPAFEVFDEEKFIRHCRAALDADFPDGRTLHAIACKTQPTRKILELAATLGLGCETASYPELVHALQCGFDPSKIIFDSPSKTRCEIEFALEKKVWINADNFSEVDVMQNIIDEKGIDASAVRCGVRINVQTFSASSDVSSITSTSTSKFGVGLKDDPDAILKVYADHPWLNAIHCHCGSQGVDVDFLASGAALIMELVNRINAAREGGQVTHIDIGGGLKNDYISDSTAESFQKYALKVREKVPELWSGKYTVATEFGRAYSANSIFSLSFVEYTKNTGGRHIATTHLGADYFLRACYHPHQWMPKVSCYSKEGAFMSSDCVETDVAGPLCFSGDLIVRKKMLPRLSKGDIVMIHDTGAYAMSMWSRYNSRQAPPTIGVRKCDESSNTNHAVADLLNGNATIRINGFELFLVKRGETVADVLRFWE